MKDQVIFDTTDAGTIADSDKILAGLISTDGTTLLTDTAGAGANAGKQGQDVYVINNDFDVNLQAGDGTDITQTGGALDVNIASGSITVTPESVHKEDDLHVSGDDGSFSLSIRLDDLTVDNSAFLAGTNGDYQGTFTNAKGEMYVKSTDSDALLTTIDAVLDSIKLDTAAMVVDLAAIEVEQLAQGVTLDAILVDTTAISSNTSSIDSTLTALSKAEDSVHVSGDQGVMALAVRNDAGAALAADGDYIPFSMTSTGALRVEDIGEGADSALANTALANTATVVGNTVTDLVGTDLADRKYAFIANLGNKKIFVGNGSVTAANGFPVSPGSTLELRAGASIDLHAIKLAGGSANDTRILELA